MSTVTDGVQDSLTLRPLTESDVTERYLSWFQDEQVTKHLAAKNLTKEDVIDYIRQGKETGEYFMYAILYDGLHIGNVKVGPIDKESKLSDLVVVIGDKDYWGKGLATEVIKIGNKIAFTKHGIRKLSGGMPGNHIGSIKAYTRAGWIIEAHLKDHYISDGILQDRVCVSCFADK